MALKVQVGVVIFSTTAENVFYLNDYGTKEEVQRAIMRYGIYRGDDFIIFLKLLIKSFESCVL